MESILELLKMSPAISIVLGFIFAGFLAYLFRDTIALYIKKKYNLFDKEEVKDIVKKIHKDIFITTSLKKVESLDQITEKVINDIKSKI